MRAAHITTDVSHGIATITLNRPERRNALNRAMTESLTDTLRDFVEHEDVRLFVLRGRGDAFCIGADLDELSNLAESDDIEGFESLARSRADLVRQLALDTPQPVISVLEGPATGVGLAIALASDFMLTTGHAKFGAPQVRLGLYPDAGLTFLLPERIGVSIGNELLWTGRIVDAHDASRLGMISRITAYHALDRELRVLIGDVVEVPRALRDELKAGTRAGWGRALEEALQREQRSARRAFETDEFRRRLEARRRRTPLVRTA